MSTIVFASSKGGAGKTTAAIILASEFAQQAAPKGKTITLIDADPNQHSAKWAFKPGCPLNIKVVENSNEDSIIDDIDNANQDSAFVIVDLEGTASMAVASAISRADLVIILCQGSQDDADEAIKTIKLIRRQEKLLARKIVYSVLFTRTHPAIRPRTLTYITDEFKKLKIEMFRCSLIDREVFRAVRSFGGTIENLDQNEVSSKDKAIANIKSFTEEVKIKLLNLSR